MTQTITYPKVPMNLLAAVKKDGMEIDNNTVANNPSVAHIQLLSVHPKGQIYYISEEESINNMGEPTAKRIPHSEFDIEDLIGDIIFIKYREENKGKFWKYRPEVKPEVLEHFPKTLFTGKNFKSSIQSQLTMFQKIWFSSKFPEYEEQTNDNIFVSTILVNKNRFPFREGHKYVEVFYNVAGKDSQWVERIITDTTDPEPFVQEVPGFILDIYNGKVLVHIFNPYYFKK